MNPNVRRSLDRIGGQFGELKDHTAAAARSAERVSGWSVAQHLDHLMKADRTIFESFAATAGDELIPVTLVGKVVLWSGWIPRGKGKAPSGTQPESPSPDELASEIATIEALFAQSVVACETLTAPEPVSNHPYFGGLNRGQWLRFVAVHHHHHLKIIRDILRADPT